MRRSGFTLIEMIVVLSITAIGLTFAGVAFNSYFQRVSAERAAQVFAQDLTLARDWAVRSREPVVIRFYEGSLWYEVEAQSSATEVARRRFGVNADIDLSGVTLDFAGDSVVFNSRGIADLSGAGGPLGTATFSSGPVTYTVSFNSMGASKIDRT
ncbi:MAG: type II secretion system protein [Gemmatimonadota bacterium]|jgi:prepilin-type N-terminal cleavage/methylation domain-containing protein